MRCTEWWDLSNGLYGARLKKGVEKDTALTKLAAYEDCAPEPEDFEKLKKELASLKQQIEDGTLVKLPCKVGGTVWVITTSGMGEEQPIECVMDDIMRLKAVNYNLEILRPFDGKIGNQQTVYITREEAESAPGKEKSNGD